MTGGDGEEEEEEMRTGKDLVEELKLCVSETDV